MTYTMSPCLVLLPKHVIPNSTPGDESGMENVEFLHFGDNNFINGLLDHIDHSD